MDPRKQPHQHQSASSHRNKTAGAKDLAAEVIRKKLQKIYDKEPSARVERQEVSHLNHPPSKHQQYMQQLSSSGRSLADIQTAWHSYYVNLPDQEKHQVWQEFYAEHSRTKQQAGQQKQPAGKTSHQSGTRNVGQVKQQLLGRVGGRGKLKAKHHIQSLVFGLSIGAFAVLILLFGFFNERIIAPFVTPSRTVSDTPIIVDTATTVSAEPRVIIPKINVDIPVVYDATSIAEDDIQAALERGVVHYPTTPNPGQVGNSVIFGHSSNNILNSGKYKFAFVLLNRLEVGDTFMLTKDSKRYVYRVYKKEVVRPTDVGVMGPQDKPSTATLITCDPPGTSINRLVVFGEQISPDPSTNGASTAIQSNQEPAAIPSDAPTLWQRLTGWLAS